VVKLQGKNIIRFLVCFSIALFLLAHPTVAKETTLTDFVFFPFRKIHNQVCAQREKLILVSSPFTNNRQIQNHTERDRQENTDLTQAYRASSPSTTGGEFRTIRILCFHKYIRREGRKMKPEKNGPGTAKGFKDLPGAVSRRYDQGLFGMTRGVALWMLRI